MTLDGFSDETNGYNKTLKNGLVNDVNDVKAVVPPIGTINAWHKTTFTATTSTTTSTLTNKIVDSSASFLTTAKKEWIVKNSTDGTWSYIVSIDNDSQITLADDIFVSGEVYIIYAMPRLPDAWVECNGQTISDTDSPLNGKTIPDLNGNNYFLRGSSTSGTTGGSATMAHTHTVLATSTSWGFGSGAIGRLVTGVSGAAFAQTNLATSEASNTASLPPYINIVWIMRVK